MILRKMTPYLSVLLLLVATTMPAWAAEGGESINPHGAIGWGLALLAIVLPLVIRRMFVDR
ncbi:MAG TPA: hypothetical protein VLL52_13110 [Anaerolineae bacterium]|nr:hypothetical protein [Anaerolineae bacterium]